AGVAAAADQVVQSESTSDEEQIGCEWIGVDGSRCVWRGGRSQAEDHVSKTHVGRGEKKPMCRWNECGKTFAKRYLLLRHIRCIHCDDKPYECSVCGTRFSLRERLKLHKRVVHEEAAAAAAAAAA
ncbi:hypothetical protein PFISCL1PPCAC_8798, partial [Pristionchus fissidentatus]